MRGLVFIALVLFVNTARAQHDFREVDSVSYALYQSESWMMLSEYGSRASKNGFDYYYLNVRTGVAYFKLKEYKRAKIYFEKALQNNSASLFAKEYLFWCLYDLEDEVSAYAVYKTLPDTIKERMDYKPTKVISGIYLEGGMKFSNNRETGGNMAYGSISLMHKLSPNVDLLQTYMYYQQDAIWGKMRQHQYLFMPGFNLRNKWRISLGLNYANYQSNLDYHDSTSYSTHSTTVGDSGMYVVDTNNMTNYLYQGVYRENVLLAQLNLTKRIGAWSLTPHVSLYTEWVKPSYISVVTERNDIYYAPVPSPPTSHYTTTSVDSTIYTNEVFTQFQAGFDLSYTISNRLTLGGDLNYIHNDYGSKWNFSPYLKLQATDRFSVTAYYVKKSNYVLGINQGATFLNTYDQVSRFSLTAGYEFKRPIGLYFTYQYEKISDNLSLRDYTFNSLFFGLKIRL